ncbi:inactive pancreatic lipase-related protein 1 [Folsomia candida]|uniref:inactive pancreatic lipase-related protein 1 n=1 Tax=Folsomia candida TaxID=158441 RepID=UPI000B8FF337|nr:inactive pancreatic lipase-related protein 1 [Folsomia candida]
MTSLTKKMPVMLAAILFCLVKLSCSFSMNPDDVHFLLFPRTDRTVEIKHGDAGSLSVSGYDASKPVVFILHGGSFTPFNFQNELKPGAYVATLRDEYLGLGVSNVIAVDYSALVSLDENPAAILQAVGEVTINLAIVGRRISEFIQFLIKQNVLRSPDAVQLVGWSLGGQLAGVTGSESKKLGLKVPGRITALDPMGLTFGTYRPAEYRLDVTDASFVDVVYTTSSNSITPLGPIGHVNFYPNAINAKGGFPPMGGSWSQPPCNYNLADLNGNFWCSHNQAWKYFVWSINNPGYKACKCSNTDLSDCKQPIKSCPNVTTFGQHVPLSARGICYLAIGPNP